MPNKITTAIAWYGAEDWATIKARATDSHKLHDTYEDWLADAVKNERALRRLGQHIVRIAIDPDALTLWCSLKGIDNDGAARSEYAVERARKQDQKKSP